MEEYLINSIKHRLAFSQERLERKKIELSNAADDFLRGLYNGYIIQLESDIDSLQYTINSYIASNERLGD